MTSNVEKTSTFLPTEILQGILQYLVKSDLKSVRLTSRLFSCCATELLFDTVYISAFEIDYEVFSAVAEHPRISKCVKCLKYDVSHFSLDIFRRNYRLSLCNQLFKKKGPLRNVSFAAAEEIWYRIIHLKLIEEGYQKFRRFARLQRKAADNEQYWMTVSRKIRNFTNLVSVEVYAIDSLDIASCGGSSRIGSPLYRSWNPLHLYPSASSATINALNGTSELKNFTTFLMGAPQPVKSLEMIRTRISMEVMSAEYINCQQLMQGEFWPFERLEVLTLCFHQDLETQTYQAMPPSLPCLLRAASRLRRLKLELPRYNGKDFQLFNLRDIIPLKTMIWPDLESFTIMNVSADALSLMMLLRFKIPNLRSLGIGFIELSQGNWLDVIECMHCYLNLSSLILEHIASFRYPGVNRPFLWDKHPEVKARFSDGFPRGNRVDFPTDGEVKELMKAIEDYVVHGGRHPWKYLDLPDSAFQEKSYLLTSSARKLMEQVEESELLLHQ